MSPNVLSCNLVEFNLGRDHPTSLGNREMPPHATDRKECSLFTDVKYQTETFSTLRSVVWFLMIYELF